MLWYLASPYGDDDPNVMQDRFDQTCKAAARLMRSGLFILSPIAHSHPIAQYGLPKGWDYWQEVDLDLLARCDGLIILCLDGWAESRGVSAETEYAAMHGYHIRYEYPDD
jgi:hypothetical protein